MVKRLHDNHTILQTDGLTIDERLVGHIIIFVIRIDVVYSLVLEDQTGHTIARRHPDIVHLILHNRVDHVVQQTIALGDDLWQHVCLLAIELQPLRCSHPGPATGILEDTVHIPTPELGHFRLVFHISGIHRGLMFVPGVSREWCLEGTRVEQSSTLCTYPHTTLTIEAHHVQVRIDGLAALHLHGVEMTESVSIDLIHPIAILTGNEQQGVGSLLHGEVIQMVWRTHDFLPRALLNIKLIEYSFLVTISDLVELGLVLQQHGAVFIDRYVLRAVGTSLIDLLFRLHVDELQQTILIEQHQQFLVEHFEIL